MKRHNEADAIPTEGIAILGDCLEDVLQRACDRLTEFAKENNKKSPLSIRLVDADMRCLVKMEMYWNRDGWHSQLVGGDLESRTGISFPWFIVAEYPSGQYVKFPVEPHQIN